MKKKYSYRLKTSYGAYKRYIREFKEKGLYVDPSEVMTKKQFDYEYAQYKARGKTNITRELAMSIPSAQYSRYQQIISKYKEKGYKVDETIYDVDSVRQMNYEDFKMMFKEFQKIRSSRKPENEILKRLTKSVAQEMAEGTLLFTPSFAKDYAKEMQEEFQEGETKYSQKALVKDIMAGSYKGADLFQRYIDTHGGWYMDEQGNQHIKKHIREQFEAMY